MISIISLLEEIASNILRIKDSNIKDSSLQITYLTIFSHSEEEYEELIEVANSVGKKVGTHNGDIFSFRIPLIVKNGEVHNFRIRIPDKERPQVGCGDFKVENLEEFREKYEGKENFLYFDRNDIQFMGIHDPKEKYLVYFMEKEFI